MHESKGKKYQGVLVYVVGPSGAGKDSLISYAEEYFSHGLVPHPWASLYFCKRYITRPATAGGEEHLPISQEEFAHKVDLGQFLFHWQSHGLSYGINAETAEKLSQGAMVVLNGSRAYATEVIKKVQPVLFVEITVQSEVLRQRLYKRGREDIEAIGKRLEQASLHLPTVQHYACMDNSGELAAAQKEFINILCDTGRYGITRSYS